MKKIDLIKTISIMIAFLSATTIGTSTNITIVYCVIIGLAGSLFLLKTEGEYK